MAMKRILRTENNITLGPSFSPSHNMKLSTKRALSVALAIEALIPAVAMAWASSRRAFLANNFFTLAVQSFVASPAHASLLEEYGSDPKTLTTTTISSTFSNGAASTAPTKTASEISIEPNLRSNYYYPTSKKRYLPRIQKVSQAIPGAFEALQKQDWDALQLFATKVAEDIVLPLQLYASSLTGGGTNVKVSYLQDMNRAAKSYQTHRERLATAVENTQFG